MAPSLFAPESLALLLSAVVVFKTVPNIPELIHGGLPGNETKTIDNVYKLVIVLTAAAAAVSTKWVMYGTASITLFSLMFVGGAVIAILRSTVPVTSGAFPHKINADPLTLLVQLVVMFALLVFAARNGYESRITLGLFNSNATLIGLIACSLLFFKPLFVYHELADAKLFNPPGNKEIIMSAMKNGKRQTRNGKWLSWVARVVVQGSAPFVILANLGIIEVPVAMWAYAMILSVAGLSLSSELGQWWTLLRSIRSESAKFSRLDLMWSSFYLTIPYLWIFVAGLINCVISVYISHVTSWGSSSNANANNLFQSGDYWGAIKEMRSSTASLIEVLPSGHLVQTVANVGLDVILLCHAVHVIVTIAYKRTITVLKSVKQ